MKMIYVDKALDQIQREIEAICKKWGLDQNSFAFSNKGKMFIVGNGNQMFIDRLSMMYLNRSLKKYEMKEKKGV